MVGRFFCALAVAGRFGPWLLCAGVSVGLFFPVWAAMARPLMGLAVFFFTLGAFLKVDGLTLRKETADRPSAFSILLWSTFLVPLVGSGLILILRPPASIAIGILLCMLAPPVGSAAAIAAMLRLNAPLALVSTIFATVLAPFYLPPLAAVLTGAHLEIDATILGARLALISGGAASVAWVLRRYTSAWVAQNQDAITGIAVAGLIVVGVGAMHGMQPHVFGNPLRCAFLLGIAFAVNIFFQWLGAALFAHMGRERAMTVGLISGNRNVTLIWAAAAPFVASHPQVELYLAMSVFPIFMLPLATQFLLQRMRCEDHVKVARLEPSPIRGTSD